MDSSVFIGTWWAIVPPLVAIVLAFITKEVYSSLFIGIVLGGLLYGQFNPWISVTSIFTVMKDNMDINILIFDVMLGMIIVLLEKSGGSAAYGRWASGCWGPSGCCWPRWPWRGQATSCFPTGAPG